MLNSRISLLFVVLCCFACQDDDDFVEITDNPGEPENVAGMYDGEEEGGDFVALYDSLITMVDGFSSLYAVAEVDHAANAAAVGLQLRPTRVVLLSSPAQSAPVLRDYPLAGLDFPQKILTYEAEDGDVFMTFDISQYYNSRYGIEEERELQQITTLSFNLVQRAGISGDILSSGPFTVERNAGIVTYTANGTVDSVYTALRTALASNEAISIVTEVDHQADAATVDVEMPPNRLIVFGNPNLGTPLLLEAQTLGLDLPQKMLVYESAPGEVTVAYNDPAYLADRHGVDQGQEEIATIGSALEQLASAALGL